MHTSSTEALPRVALLGVGSMGGAILAGLRAPGVRLDGPIAVTTRTAASAAAYGDAEDVEALASEADPEANRRAVRGAGVVILAVKPWAIHELLREIAGELAPGTIVVSVAAGITTVGMEEIVPSGVAVVRAMPNTPSLIGQGVTGIAGGGSAGPGDLDTVRRVFDTVGRVLVVDEERIDALSAVSGSGPAYLFFFAEQFTAAAIRLGFSEEEARVMAEGTVTGAAELLARSGEDPAELRRRVTSPNGTTERAIDVLQEGGWAETFDAALAAAIARSKELAAG
ncbi:MAG: pyrroline-5-carboxylate reductase [Leucobacter sp.]